MSRTAPQGAYLSARTNHIGIAVNEMTNLYHMETISAIEKYAMKRGYIVTVFDLNFDMKITMDNIEQLGLDALINFTTIDYNKHCIELLFERGTVLVNFGLNLGMSFEIDSDEAITDVMRRIKEYGHEKVGFVCTIDEMRFKVDIRARTMMRLRRELGFCLDEDLIAYASNMSETSERAGYNGCMELMKRRPDVTCLMLTNDMSAVGAVRALKDLGVSVPGDVSVVGFDGIRLTELLVPSLTTVSFDKDEYGKRIAEKLSNISKIKNLYRKKLYG